jgi:hypothetical protein
LSTRKIFFKTKIPSQTKGKSFLWTFSEAYFEKKSLKENKTQKFGDAEGNEYASCSSINISTDLKKGKGMLEDENVGGYLSTSFLIAASMMESREGEVFSSVDHLNNLNIIEKTPAGQLKMRKEAIYQNDIMLLYEAGQTLAKII